jgi:sterol desaturase/sphingolipid hydroxylase (fatty acid hydroxylase superfamily)
MDILDHEALIRLGWFAGVLVVMSVWEALAPRRKVCINRPLRWSGNLGLIALDTLIVRLLIPIGGVYLALIGRERGWGLLNNVAWPDLLAILLAFVALDFVVYLQHVMFHAVPALWRLHMVHHADLELDATTGVRFHPLEILVSAVIKLSAIVLIGAPALAVLLFEVVLNATSLFNHGNVKLPAWLDRLLRWITVTPDMHRVHHSIHPAEANSNFGFNLPWWDYLLGTYRPQPIAGHERMALGLEHLRDAQQAERLDRMLLLPFLGQTGEYPVSERWTHDASLPTGV